MGGGQISDIDAIQDMLDSVITNNQKQVDNYQKSPSEKRPKLLGFFVGQVMKLSNGKANPTLLNELLIRTLDNTG